MHLLVNYTMCEIILNRMVDSFNALHKIDTGKGISLILDRLQVEETPPNQ